MKNNKRAFTLIELLVTVLILAILMAIALPLYLSAIKDSEKKTCRANMQTIATAVQAYRVKYRAPDYEDVTGTLDAAMLVKLADLGTKVICPSGGDGDGDYEITDTSGGDFASYAVKCLVTTGDDAHGTFEPGVDGS